MSTSYLLPPKRSSIYCRHLSLFLISTEPMNCETLWPSACIDGGGEFGVRVAPRPSRRDILMTADVALSPPAWPLPSFYLSFFCCCCHRRAYHQMNDFHVEAAPHDPWWRVTNKYSVLLPVIAAGRVPRWPGIGAFTLATHKSGSVTFVHKHKHCQSPAVQSWIIVIPNCSIGRLVD